MVLHPVENVADADGMVFRLATVHDQSDHQCPDYGQDKAGGAAEHFKRFTALR